MNATIKTQLRDMSEYEQLVTRLEHIDRAFITRRHIKLHYAKQMPSKSTEEYIKVIGRYREFFYTFEESLLWFISVELHSRFLAGSERGLYKFICSMDSDYREHFKNKIVKLSHKHSETICHIRTQRNKYFAHADDVKWDDFPNLFDKELDNLLKDLKELLNEIGEYLGEQRRVTPYQEKIEQHTNLIFNDLLGICEPEKDVDDVAQVYEKGVEEFLKK